MNVNDRSSELCKSGKVTELWEYLTEIFPIGSVATPIPYNYVFDTKKLTPSEVTHIMSLGIKSEPKDTHCYEAFNTITVTILVNDPTFILRTVKRTYTIFQIENGGWIHSGHIPFDAECIFEPTTFDKIVSTFTDLSFTITEDFTYLEQLANDELLEVYSEMANAINKVTELFYPTTNALSINTPIYNRYKIFVRPLVPILKDLGIIVDINDSDAFFANEDMLKMIMKISKHKGFYKFHLLEFDYNGISYELYRDFGTSSNFILEYSNVFEELSADEVVYKLQGIYDSGIGQTFYDDLFNEIQLEDPDFVKDYMNLFTHYTGLVDELNIFEGTKPAPDFDMEPEKLLFARCILTGYSTLIPHAEVLKSIGSSDVVRIGCAEYKNLKIWFNIDRKIFLQNTETHIISKFENLIGLEKHLEDLYNAQLNKHTK